MCLSVVRIDTRMYSPTSIALIHDNNGVSSAVHLVLIVCHGSMVGNVLAFLFVLCLTMYQLHNILHLIQILFAQNVALKAVSLEQKTDSSYGH